MAKKRRYKKKKKSASNLDIAIVTLIVLSVLLAVLIYTKSGVIGIKLNEILGLKLLCMEPEVCKIGIPVNSIETYMKKIEEKEYSYKEE